MQVVEKLRQLWTFEPDLERRGIELQPETGLDQRQDGGAGQACGAQATGYVVGAVCRRAKPQNSSGRRAAPRTRPHRTGGKIRCTGSLNLKT